VIDEVDRMLEMGFEKDLRQILTRYNLPLSKAQKIFCSATFPPEIMDISKEYINNAIHIKLPKLENASNKNIKQSFLYVENDIRKTKLLELLNSTTETDNATANPVKSNASKSTIIFANMKYSCAELFKFLKQSHKVSCLNGDMTQMERERSLAQFSKGESKILIATDVASRGLDLPSVTQVINYDLPT